MEYCATGGLLPGKPKVKGDSLKNDTLNIKASPGEMIIPITVVEKGPEAIKEFAIKAMSSDVAKKNYSSGGKVQDKSLWDKIKDSFEEDQPKTKTQVKDLDPDKAKSFSSVFNTDKFNKGGVVSWDATPPTAQEMAKLGDGGQSWDSTPPTKEELAAIDDKSFLDKPILGGTVRGYTKGLLNQLPTAGMLAGGAVGGAAAGGLTAGVAGPAGAVAGAGLGSMAGESLKKLGEKYILGEEPPTREKLYSDFGKAGMEGAAGEMGGQVIGKGLSKLGDLFTRSTKPNAEEITAAAEAIGTKPTQGMLSSSPVTQGLESSLEQSPSIAGSLVRRETKGVRGAIQKATESVFDDIPMTQPSEIGSKVKEGMIKNIAEKSATIGSYYDDIRASTQSMDISPRSVNTVAKNIENIVTLKSSPGYGIVQGVAEDLRNMTNVNEIKTLRSSVGRRMSAPNINPDEYSALSQVYGKLANLEQNSIMRAAINTARNNPEGVEIGKELVSDLKSANKQFKGLIGDVKEVASGSGVSKNLKSIDQFITKLEQIPDEKIVDTLFKPDNYKYLDGLRSKFPEQFEALRQAKIDAIRKSVEVKGEINTAKLLKAIKGMEPKTRELLFGVESSKVMSNLETVVNSLPAKVGPSGTPQGMEFSDFFSPAFWIREPAKMGQYGVLKGSAAINKGAGMLKGLENEGVGQTLLKTGTRGLLNKEK